MKGLQYVRQKNGLSLQELSDMMNVSVQMTSKWERGDKPISNKRALQLADLFHIPEKYFSMELTELDTLTIDGQLMLHKVSGVIEVEDMTEADDNQIEITPKHFSTDPRFVYLYRNYLKSCLVVSLEEMKGYFNDIAELDVNNADDSEESKLQNQVKVNQILAIYQNIVSRISRELYNVLTDATYNVSDINTLFNEYGKYFGAKEIMNEQK